MYNHILIPVALDHERLVPGKIKVARRMLSADGRITLLTVLEDIPGFVSEMVTTKQENHLTQRINSGLESAAKGSDDIDTRVIKGKPGVQISEFARSEGVDLIVVGSHSPSTQDYYLGSTASRVARRAPCSVFILR
ncbi:MAG: universal stress protein [Rhodobacteraceae bacterium]|nr:universal stress protein [Paracoccaceae bacterium]